MRFWMGLIGLLLPLAGGAAQSASQILDQTARRYANLQALRVEMRSVITYEIHAQGTEVRSTMQAVHTALMRRPNFLQLLIREQRQTAFGGGLYSDGTNLYIENAALRQTLRRDAPKTLREIYTQRTLAEASMLMIGIDPMYLSIYGDWRRAASAPKLVGRERVGNRPAYKITVRLDPSAFEQRGITATQTLWIGVQDKLIWRSQINLRMNYQGQTLRWSFAATITRQEVNPNLSAGAFAYKLPKDFKLVERFEMPDPFAGVAAMKGKPAQAFALKDLSGKEVRLADYKGKVVVLNIFAHWCGPCRREAPELEKDIWQAYRDRDVVVLGIATWANGDPLKQAEAFAKEFKLTFPVLVDADNKVAELYSVQGVPTTYVIDKEGVIREVIVGVDMDKLKRAIEALL